MNEKNQEQAKDFYNLEAEAADGSMVKFDTFKGNTLIIVNIACKCGFAAKTFNSLGDLLTSYYDRGLRVLLFPCNQYLNQEPGSMEEIENTIKGYSSKFILFKKVNVFGKKIHPVYKHLIKYGKGFLFDTIKWNFTKFLINPEGVVIDRISPINKIKEDDEKLLKCLEKSKPSIESSSDKIVPPDPEDSDDFNAGEL